MKYGVRGWGGGCSYSSSICFWTPNFSKIVIDSPYSKTCAFFDRLEILADEFRHSFDATFHHRSKQRLFLSSVKNRAHSVTCCARLPHRRHQIGTFSVRKNSKITTRIARSAEKNRGRESKRKSGPKKSRAGQVSTSGRIALSVARTRSGWGRRGGSATEESARAVPIASANEPGRSSPGRRELDRASPILQHMQSSCSVTLFPQVREETNKAALVIA